MSEAPERIWLTRDGQFLLDSELPKNDKPLTEYIRADLAPKPTAGDAELAKRLGAVAHAICLHWNSLPPEIQDGANACSNAISRLSERRGEWQPTHKHLKSGNLYQVIAHGHDASRCDLEDFQFEVVIYYDEKGEWWVRVASEFNDGRFQPLPETPR